MVDIGNNLLVNFPSQASPYRGRQQKQRTLNDSGTPPTFMLCLTLTPLPTDSTPSAEEDATHADTLASSSTSHPSRSSKVNNIAKLRTTGSTIRHTRKTSSLVSVRNHDLKRAPSKHVTTPTEDQRTKERLLKNPGPKTVKSQQATLQQVQLIVCDKSSHEIYTLYYEVACTFKSVEATAYILVHSM